jgi:type I restriction enzyme, S subunit
VKHIASTAKQWPVRRLGDLLVRHNEIIHPGDRKDGEATFVGLEHIEPNTGRRTGSLTIDLGKLTGRKPTFHRGQIVYGYLRPYLNKVWIADFDGCSSVDQFAFDVRTDIADRAFLAAFMRSETFLRRSEVVTTTGQLPRISVDEIARVPIELPPIADQRRIAAHLEQALAAGDNARRAAEQRLVAAEALSAAYFRDVFESPKSREWEAMLIGELATTCSGSTPPRGRLEYFGGDIPWVKTGELQDGLVGVSGTTEETVTALALRECSLPRLPPGTLLVAMYGQGKTRGRTGLLACEATTNQACFAILPRPSVFSSEFLQLWFRANYARLRTLTENRGGNQPNLNGILLRQLQVALPDLSQQHCIAADLSRRLEAADSLITRCREELATIYALRASFLRAAFNGAS